MPKFTKRDFASADFLEEIKAVRKEFLGMAKDARAVSKVLQEAKGFKAFTDASKKAADTTNRFAASEKKLIKTLQATRFAQTEGGKQQALANERRLRAIAVNKKFAQSQLAAAKSTNTFGKAIKSFLFKANFLANVMSNLTSVISRQFIRAVRGAFNTITGFEQAMADVRAITKATDEEFRVLGKSARDLGGSTKFTATEVAKLQKEYGKLGFATQEIINAQEATLNLAAATKTDLARAAEVVGVTIRQFGLNAKEAIRVTDVMAESFTSTALDTERFAEAMKFVGPAAKASNITLERTTAILGQLADAGITGSMAGTSLRQIMLALSKESGTFSEKIERAAKSGLTLAGAAEEVQKRAATALLVMADGVDTIDDFTEALERSAGAAEEMARVQLETLKGQVTIVRSAWERYILSLATSEEQFILLKAILDGTSSSLNSMADRVEENKEEASAFNKIYKDLITGLKLALPILSQETVRWGEIKAALLEAKVASNETGLSFKELIGGFKEFGEFVVSEGRKIWEGLIPPKDIEDEQIETLEILNDELKKLRDNQKTASRDEIGFINNEIVALQKKIKEFKNIGIVIERLPEILKEASLKFTQEEKAIFDELISDINEQFGIIGPLTKEELEILNDITLENADFLNDALIKKRNEFNEEAIDNTTERVDREIEEEERLAETEAQIQAEKRDLIKQAGTEVFNFLNNLTDRRVQKLEDEAKRGIISEKKLTEEKAKLARRAAIINKASALFNIAIDTAQGVIKYTSDPLTIGLVPFVIAVGIASAAAVVAQPIPKFAKGTKSSPVGPAVVGEKGSELWIDPSGHVGLTPNKESLVDLKKGTQIYPADVTSQILKYSAIANGFEGRADDGMIVMMAEKLDRLERAIKVKPVASSIVTPAGFITGVHKGNTTIKKIDKFFK